MIDKDYIALISYLVKFVNKLEADGCELCKYQDKESWEMPCSDCKNTHVNHWRAKENGKEKEKT